MPLSPKRLCTLLCVALALVFGAASASSAVDRIQHPSDSPMQHAHLLLGDVSVDTHDHQDAEHSDSADDQDDGAPSDGRPGPGHHHADAGPGVVIFASGTAHLRDLGGDSHGFGPDRVAPGLSIRGPERPPKGITTSV